MRSHDTRTNFTAPPIEQYKVLWNPLASLEIEDDEEIEADLGEIREICSFARQIREEFGVQSSYTEAHVRGMEVGDDRVDNSSSPFPLSLSLAVQEKVVCMKTSRADTFISSRYWNFCEVSNAAPTTPDGSFDMARKLGDFSNLEFTDAPVMRIIIDCSKSDNSHSSTSNGKASMLGSRLSTPRSSVRSTLMLASLLQDGCLNTMRSTDPKYLPRILGGSGVRPLYDNYLNLFLYLRAYRGGGYDRLYGSATQELIECLRQLDRGQSVHPGLCFKLRDKQEYLFGTYANIVLIAPEVLRQSGEMPLPLYNAVGAENRYQAYENRLIRTRHVVGRTDAEREWDRTQRIREILRTELSALESTARAKERSKAKRRGFELSLNANAQLKRLLDKRGSLLDVQELIGSGWRPVTTGATAFTLRDALWIFDGCRSEIYSAADLIRTEDIFLRSEVSTDESFRVGGIHLYPVVGAQIRPTTTRSTIGLYQINQSMLEWSEDLVQRLIGIREAQGVLTTNDLATEFERNREWVNDDTALIGQCLRETATCSQEQAVVLVSSDRRLGNQMANQANVQVVRIEPLSLIVQRPRERYDHMTTWSRHEVRELLGGYHQEKFSHGDFYIYVDTGSLAAWAAKIRIHTDSDGVSEIRQRRTLTSGINPEGKRYSRYLLERVKRERADYEVHRPIRHARTYKVDKPVSSVYAGRYPNRHRHSVTGLSSSSGGVIWEQ